MSGKKFKYNIEHLKNSLVAVKILIAKVPPRSKNAKL
jgi:hypothetical protein